MQQKVKLAMIALCYSPLLFAQNATEQKIANGLDENAFTFTEAQLGEDDDMSQNVTILNSNSNVYASEAGYLFSPVRFRYRAFNQKYNDVYINGAPMNDMESGQFRFSNIGGLNRFSRNVDFALPFEGNNYSIQVWEAATTMTSVPEACRQATMHLWELPTATTRFVVFIPIAVDSTTRDGPSQRVLPIVGQTAVM